MDLIGRYGLTKAQSGPVTPLDLPLDFWIRADDVGGVANGDPITAAVDKSGNGVTWEEAGTNRPTLVASDAGINGEPSIQFSSGSSQRLMNTGAGFLNFRNKRSFTEYIVFRNNFSAGATKLVTSGDTLGFSPYIGIGRRDVGGSPTRYFFRNDTGGSAYDQEGSEPVWADSTTWWLLVMRHTAGAPATLRMWANGVLDETGTYTSDFDDITHNGIAAGMLNGTITEHMSCRVADYWVSGASDSLETINAMKDYVNNRYGLSVGVHT